MAQVLRPVLDSRTGLQEAIPAGTRVIGETRASPRFGERRIAIIWSRLILPDGREIALDDPALDAAGRTGIPARTDNHWGDLFGAALLGTVISAGAAAAEDAGRDEILIGGQEAALRGREPRGILAEGVAATASAASARALDRSLALSPTLTAETGSRVSILVNRTVEF
jgi:type IV secretion system protein VirB10